MLLVLCGIPGSGKSTLSKQLAEENNASLHCFDELPGALSPKTHTQVREQMWQDIATDLRNGNDVVCDDLNTELKWRKGILDTISGIECEKTLVVLKTPLEECIRRNANRNFRLPDFVIQSINDKFEPPTLSEGWDEIIYY